MRPSAAHYTRQQIAILRIDCRDTTRYKLEREDSRRILGLFVSCDRSWISSTHAETSKITPYGCGDAPTLSRDPRFRGDQPCPSIDLNRATVCVCRTLTEVNGKFAFGAAKTMRARRTVELARLTVEPLREHRARPGAIRRPVALAFQDARGGPIRKRNLVRRSFWTPRLINGARSI